MQGNSGRKHIPAGDRRPACRWVWSHGCSERRGNRLAAQYQAAQAAKGTYAQVKTAFAAVGTTADTLTGSVNTIADTLDTLAAQAGGGALTAGRTQAAR